MKKNTTYTIIAVVTATIIGLILGNLIAHRANGDDKLSTLPSIFSKNSKIDEVLSLIETDYVDSVNVDSLRETVIQELFTQLDPHSVYIPAKDLNIVNNELESSFSGIGVQFNIQNDTILIVAVISGGPSERAGVLAGDKIVTVNDTLFVGKTKVSNEKAIRKLRGKKGTKIAIGIKRQGVDSILTYPITRGEIPLKSIDIAYEIAPHIGVINISKFAEETHEEFQNSIAGLRNKGVNKFIIDLRGNGGGLLDQAIAMINEFLPQGEMIVYSEGRAYPKLEAIADGTGSCINDSVVVIIDEFSASASEIFAGAIQDNDRGTIVGRRSFGKGLVQTQVPLSDGSAVRLTISRYYTPSGRCIQKPYTLGKAEEYSQDILKRFQHGEFENKDSIHIENEEKYKTVKGRIVYGGGGIMPDIFVPRDTTGFSPYFRELTNHSIIFKFSLKYIENNRTKLQSFKTEEALVEYLKTQNLLSKIVDDATAKGIALNKKDLAVSRKEILLRAYLLMVRNILGDEGYYQLLYKNDKTIDAALSILKK